MKIGLDIHGVINENPKFFEDFTYALCERPDDEVHIISGPPKPQIITELESMNFYEGRNYTHIFSIVDYHKEIGTTMRQDEKGNWWTVKQENGLWVADAYVWDKTKADYCVKHGIDLMIDDSDAYAYFFKTPYSRYYSKNKRKHHIVQGD